MAEALLSGMVIFSIYFREIFLLLLSGFGLGALLSLFLFREKGKNPRIVYVLVLGLASIGVLTPLLSLFGWLNAPVISVTMLLGTVALALLYKRGLFSVWEKKTVLSHVWLPLSIFLFFLLLRLAYLDGLILPPYSDSPKHFMRVSDLVSGSLSVKSFSPYYHWGFHGIVAWVQVGTRNYSPLVMTLVTQFFLALLPVSVYFMALVFVDDIFAAGFAALLAGIGWIVPAHSTHFGKYPALVGISLFPVFVGLVQLILKEKGTKKRIWIGYLFFAGCSIFWLHSRLFFLLLIFLITHLSLRFIENQWSKKKNFVDWIVAFSALAIFGIIVLSYDEKFARNFRYYLSLFSGTTFLVITLLPFAFKKYAISVFQWVLFIVLWVMATLIALPPNFYSYELTLVDQPFFELSFFLPLAILGSIGIKSVLDSFQARDSKRIVVFLFILLFVNGAMIPQPWHSVINTNYVSEADDLALSWIHKNTEAGAFVAISALEKDNYLRGSDAGVWVKTLADRVEIKLPFFYHWDSPDTIQALCQEAGSQTPIYIYSGGGEYSFHLPACQATSGLTPVFCEKQVSVYRLDCSLFP